MWKRRTLTVGSLTALRRTCHLGQTIFGKTDDVPGWHVHFPKIFEIPRAKRPRRVNLWKTAQGAISAL